MTFIIAINFPGALVLYYAITSLVAVGQQKLALSHAEVELEEIASESSKTSGELKQIKEAEIISEPKVNKKSGTKIRRLTVEKPKKSGKGGKK
jgi:membrane protein insertase Oxa1/YidC/SpoIIIJ